MFFQNIHLIQHYVFYPCICIALFLEFFLLIFKEEYRSKRGWGGFR